MQMGNLSDCNSFLRLQGLYVICFLCVYLKLLQWNNTEHP